MLLVTMLMQTFTLAMMPISTVTMTLAMAMLLVGDDIDDDCLDVTAIVYDGGEEDHDDAGNSARCDDDCSDDDDDFDMLPMRVCVCAKAAQT